MPEPTLVAVVDDDPIARMVSRRVLETADYLVAEYESGAAFLAVAISRPPNAILLDFQLGDMDGLELIDRLVELQVRRPIVIITGNPNARRVGEAMATGLVSAMLAKPSDMVKVAVAIGAAVDEGGTDRRGRSEAQARAPDR